MIFGIKLELIEILSSSQNNMYTRKSVKDMIKLIPIEIEQKAFFYNKMPTFVSSILVLGWVVELQRVWEV